MNSASVKFNALSLPSLPERRDRCRARRPKLSNCRVKGKTPGGEHDVLRQALRITRLI